MYVKGNLLHHRDLISCLWSTIISYEFAFALEGLEACLWTHVECGKRENHLVTDVVLDHVMTFIIFNISLYVLPHLVQTADL